MLPGDRGKHEGMARVERATNPAWRRAADAAVIEAARWLPRFTTDDVLMMMPDNVTTRDMRALGPVMTAAMRDGVIEKALILPVNCATRANNHSRPLQVWKSLLYRGGK